MKIPKKVKLIDKRNMSHAEWTAGRNNYLGGSDIASIMNLNPFESALEAFHRKIGLVPSSKPMQLSSYSGVVLEEVIYKNYWKYYQVDNPVDQILVDNAVANKTQRTAKRKNFTMVSEEFPWLASNVDYIIDKNPFTPVGILDCKASLQYVVNSYESNVSPGYVLQMQQYMFVTGFSYSELCFLLDGRYPKVIPIPEEQGIQTHIVNESKKFWEIVQEGRKIWDDTSMTEDQRLHRLQSIEPDVDASDSLEEYLKDRFKKANKAGQMVITQDIIDCGKSYLACNEKLSEIEGDKRLYSNLLRKCFLDNSIDELIDDKGKGIITYRNIEGRVTLRVSKDLLKV